MRRPRPTAAALRSRDVLRGPEARARYRFRDRRLLETALTHRSYLHEHTDEKSGDFERLEFLGDAVIDLVVAERLYKRFPQLREGELTAIRASLVSGNALAPIGLRLGLPKAARLGRGEEESGGRDRPALAASLFEALVGGVYLDGGYDNARALVERAMSRELRGLKAAPPKSGKTLLQEWVQAQHLALPRYLVVEVRGPEHQRDFRVAVEVDGRMAEGQGASKREAEESAASALLRKLSA
ncbi:MAG TPA: ribonuclease III [Candidatus Limnocylindria bacterium]|nr:ribonuclease III [Candidatus Limnocylindria bacterium]